MAVLPTGIGPVTGYNIERSLRFNSADSAYLNRTPASAGNRRTWTYSFWVKRAKFSRQMFLGVYTNGNDVAAIEIESDQIYWYDYLTSAYKYEIRTTQVLRDPSAWYHIVCVLDTTQATSSNRNKIYVNGSLVTALTTATYPTQNADGKFNTVIQHSIGTEGSNLRLFLDAYQTETYFIDGQALTPSSFGQTNASTGIWEPIAYTGTYGTNGFFLKFADNSNTTAGTLGKDSSGNGNNWTPNNFSVTAGVGNDSLVDSPTAYGTDTGVGGTVRGNYCTWNSTWANPTLTNGNLDYTTTAGSTSAIGTLGVSSGKWYFEVLTTTSACSIGVAPPELFNKEIGETSTSYGYTYNGTKYTNGSTSAYGNSYTANDIIGVALDLDNGKIWFSKNGTFQASGDPAAGTNAAFTGLSGTFTVGVSRMTPTQQSGSLNAGQRAFAYTAPSGFKALCTQNLPTPTIGATSTTQANDYMNVVLWTGDGTSTRSITGVGFQPDWVWIKSRNNAITHRLSDAVRGANKVLYSNLTNAEDTNDNNGYTSSFDSDGFTLTAGATNSNATNASTYTYVGWNWKANGAGSSNTAGTITSTVSANTTSGFSIVTYTGNGSGGATVGHGLGAVPSLIIAKGRGNVDNWPVGHTSRGWDRHLLLNSTNAEAVTSSSWNNTAPTSTVFTVGTDSRINQNTIGYVAYCFAAVAGYSAFGSYTGNGSTDGPFVYTGFRPRYVMVKRSSGVESWYVIDSARSTYNVVRDLLNPNSSAAEATSSVIDFLSNGFKIRDTGGGFNGSGDTYIYAAFAENPFKYSLAR